MSALESLILKLEREGYIRSKRVKETMLAVDRRDFVNELEHAYIDEPLPTMDGQTISAPHMVAMMLELAEIEEKHRILEIGTGSGYNATLLSYLANQGIVVTIEKSELLYRYALKNIKKYSFAKNIKVIEGDGAKGYPPESPYNVIIVTCSVLDVPSPLLGQLSDHGKMVVPIGRMFEQELYLIEKRGKGIHKKMIVPVSFVNMY
ncbi:MAG: protein-L-isoaspartate(D-aspartate) O-methyltransferase [Thermoplasmata archaeon]